MPVAIPEVEPISAIVLLELVHSPPGVKLINVEDKPVHIADVPEIADGVAFEVMVRVTKQPEPVE